MGCRVSYNFEVQAGDVAPVPVRGARAGPWCRGVSGEDCHCVRRAWKEGKAA